MVGEKLKENNLVILESTVPTNTTKMMTGILEKVSGLPKNKFFTAHCPERVLPGKILYELEHNDRIIGSENPEAAKKAQNIYKKFVKEGTCYITDDVTAEMCKLVENTYRDINIAFSNELSIICEKIGIDVFNLIELANRHPRVNIMNPGVGVGGHCLAVDPWFIVEKFKDDAKLINNARIINDFKPLWVSKKIEEKISYDKSKKIGILGLAYKPNIDDFRESPSVELAENLIKKGYKVCACEPYAKTNKFNGIEIKTLQETINTCDFLVITLGHDEFKREKDKILSKDNYNCVGLK